MQRGRRGDVTGQGTGLGMSGAPADNVATSGDPDRRRTAPRRRLRPGRLVVVIIVTALVGMWGYVLFLAFGPGRQSPVDRLDDPAFAQAAEVRCADALADIEQLPLATEATSAADRADVVAEANDVLASMLDDLDDLAVLAPQGDQRDVVDEWLTDWRTYVGNRRDYADALRVDSGARLLISEKPGTGRHVTGWIDEFARANRMPSCASPMDV